MRRINHEAQQSRGADFESGNIIQRAKSMIPIIVPLFVSSFRIAGDLALAMEARCYRGGNGRTKLNETRFEKRDVVAALMLIIFRRGACCQQVFNHISI